MWGVQGDLSCPLCENAGICGAQGKERERELLVWLCVITRNQWEGMRELNLVSPYPHTRKLTVRTNLSVPEGYSKRGYASETNHRLQLIVQLK